MGPSDYQLEPLEQREFLSVAPAIAAASAPRRVADRAGSTLQTARNGGVLKTTKQFRDFVGAGDAIDFYKFKMVTRTTVDLTLSGTSNKVKLALIRDKNNNGRIDRKETLAQQGGASTSRAISKVLSPGTYFVRVQQSGAANNYTLKLTAQPSDAGNTLASALKVNSPNGSLIFTETVGGSDPVDFYKITFTQSTHLILAMGDMSANADLTLIEDKNGDGQVDEGSEILAASTNANQENESITWHSFPGTYFVRVAPAGTAQLTYSLQFVTFPMA